MEGLFRVAGWLDREPYLVTVTGDVDSPTVGTLRVRALVRQFVGERVLVPPVGPAYTVDPGNGESILALLASQTELYGCPMKRPTCLEPVDSTRALSPANRCLA